MKKLLFVSVSLSVFTVTSLSVSAQLKFLSFKDMNRYAEETISKSSILHNVNLQNVYYAASKISNNLLAPSNMATELCNTIQFRYAQILNRDVENLTNLSLFNFIDEWWATKYRYGGTSKKGVDCSSFTGKLMQEVFGFTMPRTARMQYAICTKLQKDNMLEGDLVFFNTTGGVSHVGVYLGDGYFVHSSCSRGVTISNLNETYYSKKFIAGGRPNITEYLAAETL